MHRVIQWKWPSSFDKIRMCYQFNANIFAKKQNCQNMSAESITLCPKPSFYLGFFAKAAPSWNYWGVCLQIDGYICIAEKINNKTHWACRASDDVEGLCWFYIEESIPLQICQGKAVWSCRWHYREECAGAGVDIIVTENRVFYGCNRTFS